MSNKVADYHAAPQCTHRPSLADIVALLREVAQNDYMIDQHYLPTGKRLLAAADALISSDPYMQRLDVVFHDFDAMHAACACGHRVDRHVIVSTGSRCLDCSCSADPFRPPAAAGESAG